MTGPNLRVALYARYSSDNQRDASIEDQLRQCRERAAREGWTIVETYSDRAISGASLIRSGIQTLLTDAQAGRLDIVLSEALDRISRDQEDVAGVFKRLRFADVAIVTLSEGEVSELHVGLKGTMNALCLKDLAMKTHRGIRSRVEAGKIGGGNAYGYRVRATPRRLTPVVTTTIKRFHESVVGRFARSTEVQRDAVLIRPAVECLRDESSPLSTQMVLGAPRIEEIRAIVATTCSPLMPWSTSLASGLIETKESCRGFPAAGLRAKVQNAHRYQHRRHGIGQNSA